LHRAERIDSHPLTAINRHRKGRDRRPGPPKLQPLEESLQFAIGGLQVVSTFTMISKIQAFFLVFIGRTDTDRQLEDQQHHEGHH